MAELTPWKDQPLDKWEKNSIAGALILRILPETVKRLSLR
jgi:hypothetical protein